MTATWRAPLVVATAAMTAAALGGCQRSEAAPPPITAPLLVVNARPLVDAEVIDNDGKAHKVRLLLATQRDGVVFTRAAAKRAQLEFGKRVRRGGDVLNHVEPKAVRIGKTRLDIEGIDTFAVIDTNSADLNGVDGYIGTDVLRRYERVTMSFTANQLVLGDKETTPPLGVRVPTTYDDGRFTARITLGTKTHRLRIDTAAVTSHLREDVPIRITGTRQGVWGRLVVAPFEVVSDPDFTGAGVLGANLLERYTVRIDYVRETFRISTT